MGRNEAAGAGSPGAAAPALAYDGRMNLGEAPPDGTFAADARLRAEAEAARARGRRRAVVVLALVLLAGAAAAAFIVLRAPRDAVAVGRIGDGTLLRPLAAAPDPATGEVVAPFTGFALSVETAPAGAEVSIAGQPRGEAPVLAGVDCAPGDAVEVVATRGAARARHTTTCRADALVKLRLVLR